MCDERVVPAAKCSASVVVYPVARQGPIPRVPSGGYRLASTMRSASAAVSTIGTRTPSGSRSSVRFNVVGSPSGTRTSVSVSPSTPRSMCSIVS
nr:hypothetical protein [Halomicroarcula sp. SYNS111]